MLSVTALRSNAGDTVEVVVLSVNLILIVRLVHIILNCSSAARNYETVYYVCSCLSAMQQQLPGQWPNGCCSCCCCDLAQLCVSNLIMYHTHLIEWPAALPLRCIVEIQPLLADGVEKAAVAVADVTGKAPVMPDTPL